MEEVKKLDWMDMDDLLTHLETWMMSCNLTTEELRAVLRSMSYTPSGILVSEDPSIEPFQRMCCSIGGGTSGTPITWYPCPKKESVDQNL